MKYKLEDLEKMSKADLINTYRNLNNFNKKNILIELSNSRKFGALIDGMTPDELEQMAKLHPYKEVILDTIIEEIQNHRSDIGLYFFGKVLKNNNFKNFMEAIKHKSIFNKIEEFFIRKPTLPDNIDKKFEKLEEISKIQVRRYNAIGKKLEQLENQNLDQPTDEARARIYDGEMSKIFDKCMKDVCNEHEMFSANDPENEPAKKVEEQLKEEYIDILGEENSNLAKLIAMQEFENYSDKSLSLPYRGSFNAGSHIRNHKYTVSGLVDHRSWQKNLLEIEEVQNFTIGDINLGEVFIVKSEFNPTVYAIKDKWAPIYEYYIKNENEEMVRIGGGKINMESSNMEMFISLEGKDILSDIQYENRITQDLENGTVIKCNANKYTGTSKKTSRKDIECAITTKAIQTYLGEEKQIVDITKVEDMKIVSYNKYGEPNAENAYAVTYVCNGIEFCEMVYMTYNGKCESYPEMKKNTLAKKEIYFPTGMSTGYDKQSSLNILDKKESIEMFETKDGKEYAAYRDNDGVLRFAEMLEYAEDGAKYSEEMDTYSLVHGDLEKIKEQSKEAYDKSIAILKEDARIKSEKESKENEIDDRSIIIKENEEDILSL